MRALLSLLLAVVVLSLPAHAGERYDCQANTVVSTKGHFTNAGNFTTNSGAALLNAECFDKQIGGYVNAFTLLPADHVRGLEFDLRLGYRHKKDALGIDISLASLTFDVGADTWQKFNARLKFTYDIKVGGVLVIPYAGADLSRIVTTNSNDNAVFGGVVIGYDFQPNLHLTVDGAGWYHFDHPFPKGDAMVWSTTARLMYDLGNGISVGPQGQWTHGGNDRPDIDKVSAQAVMTLKW